MNHGSLFSGIGGADLAAHWAGWNNLFHSEIDPFCLSVLQYHFPDAKSYTDLRNIDFSEWRGTIDILSAGFPCQPFSQAGKRKGTADQRHLWPEVLRAVRQIRPRWVVGENVLGIVNWNEGLVFEQVCTDLEAEGYQVQPFILPAAGVNAPHQRYRAWFVAYCSDAGAEILHKWQDGIFPDIIAPDASGIRCDHGGNHRSGRYLPDNLERGASQGQSQWHGRESRIGETYETHGNGDSNWREAESKNLYKEYGWGDFPTQSPFCRADDGLPTLLDGITFSRWRIESIKAFGNAIVPQVAYRIFKSINALEIHIQHNS